MSVIVKTLTFTEDEINTLIACIFTAQDSVGDRKDMRSDAEYHAELDKKIAEYELVLKKIIYQRWQTLPEPEDFQESSVCDEQQQSLPFSDIQ